MTLEIIRNAKKIKYNEFLVLFLMLFRIKEVTLQTSLKHAYDNILYLRRKNRILNPYRSNRMVYEERNLQFMNIFKNFLGNLYLKAYSCWHPVAIVDIENDYYRIAKKKYSTVIFDCDGYVTCNEDGTIKAKVTLGCVPRTVFESTTTASYDLSETSRKRIEQSLAIIMFLSATVSNRTKILVILRNAPGLQILKDLLSRGTYTNIVPKYTEVFPGTISLGYNVFNTFTHLLSEPK